MIARALALAIVVASPLVAQSPQVEMPTRLAPLSIQLDGIPTSALVTMLLRDVMRVPYVIAPDVLADRRPTSVRLIIPRNDVPARVVAYLRRAGFTVDLFGGTVYVGRGGGSRFSSGGGAIQNPGVPWGSPLSPQFAPQIGSVSQSDVISPLEVDPRARRSPAELPAKSHVDVSDNDFLLYAPAHRDPAYLSAVVLALLPTLRVGSRDSVKAEPDQQQINGPAAPDLLALAGDATSLGRARRLIIALDRPRPMVAVKAVVMQVASVQARGSALSILANLAGGKLKGGSFGGEVVGSQFLRIGTGALSAMLSVVREDSRFKVVASPNLAALSGELATINAGSQVPTIGAVTIAEGGTPIRSVVYRDSGITLSVRPVVRGELIELDVRQERSTFVRTTTGVEDSPTLQKTSASASVVLKSGESIVLAGLNEDSDEGRREGLLGGLLGVRARDKSTSELLVVLQAELVPTPIVAPGQFLDVEEGAKDEKPA
jgi:hypothetical protein